jgi:hypothetical protein
VISLFSGTNCNAQERLASAAEEPAAGARIPSLEIGVYSNAGYGTNGLNAVPGLTLLLDRFPLGIHVGRGADSLGIAMNADWMAIDVAVPGTKVSWFMGPGIYAGWADNSGDSDCFAAGVRGVLGGRIQFFGNLEAYGSLVPAFGV